MVIQLLTKTARSWLLRCCNDSLLHVMLPGISLSRHHLYHCLACCASFQLSKPEVALLCEQTDTLESSAGRLANICFRSNNAKLASKCWSMPRSLRSHHVIAAKVKPQFSSPCIQSAKKVYATCAAQMVVQSRRHAALVSCLEVCMLYGHLYRTMKMPFSPFV